VLDLGCGSEFVASAVEPRAGSFVAVPREALLSGPGALPVQDASIDVIYSLNTLPFVSDDSDRSDEIIEHALVEISRILVAGGYALVEIANPTSLWGLYNGIRHAAKALERGPLTATTDRGMTRFETAAHFAHRLPPTLEVTNLHGLRLVTVTAHILALPLVGRIVRRIEWLCRDRGFARRFSGSQMLVLRRLSAPFVP
jgi:SAM-dependent methyltransferase